MSSLDEQTRAALAREILDQLSIQIAVEHPPYGSSAPRLKVTLFHEGRELSVDWVSLSELSTDR
jgi:hypothetical protein